MTTTKLARRFRVGLVAEPGSLTESMHRRLNELDAASFPSDLLYPKDGGWWWIVRDPKGRDVAFAGMREVTLARGRAIFLCRCGVAAPYRGHGLQRRLIRVRKRHAARLGYRVAVTYTSRENFRSANNLLAERFFLGPPWADWCPDWLCLRVQLS